MSNQKTRVQKLEAATEGMMTNDQRAERIREILQNPSLVSPAANKQIVELLEIARSRRAKAKEQQAEPEQEAPHGSA